MFFIGESLTVVLVREQQNQYAAINQKLMITAVRQHELLEAANRLDSEHRKEISERRRAEEERTAELVRSNEALIAERNRVEDALKTSLGEKEMLRGIRRRENMDIDCPTVGAALLLSTQPDDEYYATERRQNEHTR